MLATVYAAAPAAHHSLLRVGAGTSNLARAALGSTFRGARGMGSRASGGLTEEERSREGGTGGAEQQYAERRLLERMFDLTGKTAFVTGAARGMGSWIAMGMARCGADIALAGGSVGRRLVALEALACI